MINKVKEWILAHLVEVQAILTIMIFVISIISNINENSEAMMIALLVFVGTEFIILSLGYLEQINKELRRIYPKNESNTEIIVNGSFEWVDLAEKAKNDVFISMPTGGSLYNNRRVLVGIPEHINVRILIHDYNDDATIATYCFVCSPKANPQQMKEKNKVFQLLAQELILMQNVEIRVTKTPLYIAYVGCDIFCNSTNSKIRAQHFLRKYVSSSSDSKVDDKLIFGANIDTPLYQVYHRQINMLWENALPFEL